MNTFRTHEANSTALLTASRILVAAVCAYVFAGHDRPALAETATDDTGNIAYGDAGGAVQLDESKQIIIARSAVPRERKPIGEVRLIRRGNALVVETVLSTFLYSRVTAKLREAELSNWPAGKIGHEDAKSYIEALERFGEDSAPPRGAAMPRSAASIKQHHRQVKIAIEFISDPPGAWVVLSQVELDGSPPASLIVAKHPSVTLALSSTYVERNMELILADSFGLDESQSRRLLYSARPHY